MHTLWFGYFWPSLKGNGPEAIAQSVVYALAGYVLIPPFRKWVNSGFQGLHEKVDHIIKHHPDIPDFPDKDHS